MSAIAMSGWIFTLGLVRHLPLMPLVTMFMTRRMSVIRFGQSLTSGWKSIGPLNKRQLAARWLHEQVQSLRL
jgi:hypothetical protein